MKFVSICSIVAFLTLSAAVTLADDVYYPPTAGGFGTGTTGGVGSYITTGPNVGTIGNHIVFFYGTAPTGVQQGEPNVVVAMRNKDDQPILVPISQVNVVLAQAGKADNTLIVMHKGAEQVAVVAADVPKYKELGYSFGPKPGLKQGRIETRDGVCVVVTA